MSRLESTLFHIVTNDHGDVVELLDREGEAFARYAYDAWGRHVLPDGYEHTATVSVDLAAAALIAERQVLRYASYCYDKDSGLYYVSQRYYDPATMQFLSKDPARDDGEESAYQYCAGDPVGKIDPTGRWGRKVHWTLTGAWLKETRRLEVQEVAAEGQSPDGRMVALEEPGRCKGDAVPLQHVGMAQLGVQQEQGEVRARAQR